MKERGMKMYAVMAMKDSWTKPRFVHDSPSKRSLIFTSRMQATAMAGEMTSTRCVFGEKSVAVDWIVVPVWCETMGERL